MLKNKKISIVILLALFGVLFLTLRVRHKSIAPSQNQISNHIENSYVVKTILEINEIRYESEIVKQISVYDFMSKLRNEGKIDFTEKNYIGMGKFIVSINGIKGNETKNWIYYVNGKKADIGVSNYKINKGDTVSWKYEKSY